MSSTNTFFNTRNKLSNELGAPSTTSCGWGWKRYNGPPPPPAPFTYLLRMMNRINHNLCRAEAGIAYNMTTKQDHDHEDVFLYTDTVHRLTQRILIEMKTESL